MYSRIYPSFNALIDRVNTINNILNLIDHITDFCMKNFYRKELIIINNNKLILCLLSLHNEYVNC